MFILKHNYLYDLNGNRLQKAGSKNSSYYSYDSMNRLSSAKYNERVDTFTYDKVGNRLSKTSDNVREDYFYNSKNQLQQIKGKNDNIIFTYYKQGNTIEEKSTLGINSYSYNTLNQRVEAITKEGNTLKCRYDSEGLRYEIEENNKLSRFIFHKENVLVETDGEDKTKSRFARGYEIVAADIEEEKYFYVTDEQGSTSLITDKESTIKNECFYDAFGLVISAHCEVNNRITYTGQQFDNITNQYYLRARYYNPVIGRFTSEDIYRGDGLNLYAYCGNNPVIYYDPSGYAKNNKRVCKKDTPSKLSDNHNIDRNIVFEYDEVMLGRGTPNLDRNGNQRILQGIENIKWKDAKEWDVLLRNRDGSLRLDSRGRPIETLNRIVTLHDSNGKIIKIGYVVNHMYDKIRVFPLPWF